MGIQVIEKHVTNTGRGPFHSELTKGKDPAGRDFIRHDESLFGVCIAYRMIRVISSNLLEVTMYHHCLEEEEGEEEEIKEKGLRAYVETDANRIMTTINSIKDFNEVFESLYECIKKDGWGKTVKCDF